MKIAHVVNLRYDLSNGIRTVLENLVLSQEKLGNSVVVINIFPNKSQIFHVEYFSGNIRDFKKIIDSENPDVVNFHGGYEIKYYAYGFFLQKAGIPYLVTPHGGTSKFNLKRHRILKILINCFFTKRFLRKASGIIFLNKAERDNSIFKNEITNYSIIPNGTRMVDFDLRKKKESNTIHFMFLSRIDIKYKGLDILLQALEELTKSHQELNYDFHFYGGRYDPKIIETFSQMVGNTKAPVFYHGEVLGKDKDKAYENANIYVLPSLSEGMPLTVLEALSFGNPCIITPQTNMTDIIMEHNAGWITNADVRCISNTIYQSYIDYIKNRELYIMNAKNSVNSYSWDTIARRSIEEYNRLINNSNL